MLYDLRDHNPNRPHASSQLPELEGRRPAVSLNPWRPLVTADARARPLRHGPSADREGAVPSVADASRHSRPLRPGTGAETASTTAVTLVVVGTERLPADLAKRPVSCVTGVRDGPRCPLQRLVPRTRETDPGRRPRSVVGACHFIGPRVLSFSRRPSSFACSDFKMEKDRRA
jgi:hypothetical protein